MRSKIEVCLGPSCSMAFSRDLLIMVRRELKKKGLDQMIEVGERYCTSNCDKSVVFIVTKEGEKFYFNVSFNDVKRIMATEFKDFFASNEKPRPETKPFL